MSQFNVLVIGAGTAGIMVTSQLRKKGIENIALIDPSEHHYYQPAWTLVGAGTYDFKKTERPMKSLIPSGVDWIKDSVENLNPKKNELTTKDGSNYTYDYLVVAPGLTYDFSMVEGLKEALERKIVCSNYTDPEETWIQIKNFKGGTALFTQPTTPIKCGGAPQKIMYLAESHFKKTGINSATKIIFATNGGVIFGVKEIAKTLMNVVDRKDINLRFGHQLKKIDPEKKIAWYALGDNQSEYNHKEMTIHQQDNLIGIEFDFLHTAPPSVAPKFVQNSELANEGGWMKVSSTTLQNPDFNNVFGLGDVAALPTAKTGAAIRKQVPIVVDNIMKLMSSNSLGNKVYNGYSSCPLVTDYGKMVLAEFDYANNFTPDPKLKQMLIKDSSKEHWRLWMLKKYMLPYLYWNKMMKGENV